MHQTDFRQVYVDICAEIDLLIIRIKHLKWELGYYKRTLERDYTPSQRMVASYSGMPHAGSNVNVFEQQWEHIVGIEQKIADLEAILLVKLEVRVSMEARLAKLEDLDRKVLIMRDVQRKSLKQIADETGYSYGYIRKKSGNLARMYTTNAKKGTIRVHIS
jgi:hypothetical protein